MIGIWRCLCRILGIGEGECQDSARSAATLPLALGGLGLRSALRTRSSAFLASWADCLTMDFKRYPDLVADFVDQLEEVPEAEHLRCAALAARRLDGVQGFEIPSCRALMEGARPPPRDLEVTNRVVRGKGGSTRHHLESSGNSETCSSQ